MFLLLLLLLLLVLLVLLLLLQRFCIGSGLTSTPTAVRQFQQEGRYQVNLLWHFIVVVSASTPSSAHTVRIEKGTFH
jgi:hypothetical protein